jgi:hypothetical protein
MPLAGSGEVVVLDALLAGRFLSLHTGTPPGVEIPAGGYVRRPVTFAQTSGPDPTIYKNTAVVEYPAATTDWGTVTHFGVWTAVSGGNMVAYNTVTTPKAVTAGDIVRWDVGALVVDTN